MIASTNAFAKDAPPEIVELLANLTPDDQAPKLGVVSSLPVAAAVGLFHPMVLSPQSFLDVASPEKLQTVLAHELAHVRHRDLWLLALLRGVLLLLWPNPLYWLWRRHVRLDQETVADAAAADVTNRTDYAEQLIAWARLAGEARMPRLVASVGLWENPSQLKRRIAILLDGRLAVLRSCSRRWRVMCLVAATLAVLMLSLITLQPPSDAAENKLSDASSNLAIGRVEKRELEQSDSLIEILQIGADEGVICRLDPRRVTLGRLLNDDLKVDAAYSFDPRKVLAKAEKPFNGKVGYDDALSNLLRGIELDPYGPKIHIESEILANLAGRITVLTFKQDADKPKPDEWLIAVQTSDEKAIAVVIDRWMRSDHASLGNMSGRRVWRQLHEQDESLLVSVEFEHLLVTNAAELLQRFLARKRPVPTPD